MNNLLEICFEIQTRSTMSNKVFCRSSLGSTFLLKSILMEEFSNIIKNHIIVILYLNSFSTPSDHTTTKIVNFFCFFH